MSKIKNSGLDQYGAEPLEQQQFETAGVERVNRSVVCTFYFDSHTQTLTFSCVAIVALGVTFT